MTRYRLVGFLSGTFGIAMAARNTRTILASSTRPFVEIAIDERTWTRIDPPNVARPAPAASDVNLFHLNPLEAARARRAWTGEVSLRSPSVCVPFWELPLVPTAWHPMLLGMDAVLAPTRFIQAACARVLPPERVLLYPQAVFHPDVRPAREAWGIPSAATAFLVSFDVGSDIDRKNPFASIEAFQRAFPSDQDVVLVIKTRPYPEGSSFGAQSRELHGRVAGDRRIRIVDRTLAYEEVLQLYASCDAMVSLHRAEGLGLHLMEAMSLGKTVVATDWSGSQDFVTPENAIPVGHRLVPVRTGHQSYALEVGREGQVWAEPDLPAAVQALQLLHRDRTRRAALGANAARDMERRRREALSGRDLDALELLLAGIDRGRPRLAAGLRRTVRLLRAAKWRKRLGRVGDLVARLAAR